MSTAKVSKELQAQLDSIVPGKTYPRHVEVVETWEGKPGTVNFCLRSYLAGMYARIYLPGSSTPQKTGDHNNRDFVTSLKKDLIEATERGAVVTIEDVVPVKTLTSAAVED
jgi:hypothetical protein